MPTQQGIDFIEHKKYINDVISNLKKYRNNVEKREYLSDYDYA